MGLFKGPKECYGVDVVDAVVQTAKLPKEEVVKLANLIMVETRIVLARQRRDYSIDEEPFPSQYPVMVQAQNINDTPINNIGSERTCGKVDYRLQKLKDLEAVSRSIILQRPQNLMDNKPSDFRSFRGELERVKELKLSWSEKMKEKQEQGSDEKKEMARQKEKKRLDTLDCLKSKAGPFTDEREVEKKISPKLTLMKRRKLRG